MSSVRERYGEAFRRAHHEAWVQSELNQREYREAYGIPLKAFGHHDLRPTIPPAREGRRRAGGLSRLAGTRNGQTLPKSEGDKS